MGRISFKIDDKYERFIRQQSANIHLSVSEFIRQKILKSADSVSQPNSPTIENFVALKAEVIELRKELRIVTGALIAIMESNGLSIEQMKQAGKEFFKERD